MDPLLKTATCPTMRKGALTKSGELVRFVRYCPDDGEVWAVRSEDDLLDNRIIYPEDITGYSKRIYV